MFLGQLSTQQKELFIKLAFKISQCDGIFAPSEKQMLNQYCAEMSIPIPDYNVTESEDSLMQSIKECCDSHTLNKIFIEIIGLALADAEYAEAEKIFLQKACAVWGIAPEKIDEVIEVLNIITDGYKMLERLVQETNNGAKNTL